MCTQSFITFTHVLSGAPNIQVSDSFVFFRKEDSATIEKAQVYFGTTAAEPEMGCLQVFFW
jgi:hypothetical protein